jgi:hypothetical protein
MDMDKCTGIIIVGIKDNGDSVFSMVLVKFVNLKAKSKKDYFKTI